MRTTPLQKALRIGIAGGLIGGLVYVLSKPEHSGPHPYDLPPEPVERDPSPPTRGHYR